MRVEKELKEEMIYLEQYLDRIRQKNEKKERLCNEKIRHTKKGDASQR